MKINDKIHILALVLSFLFFWQCTDQWDDHTAIQEGIPAVKLMEEINSRPELSRFAGLLETAGLDKELAASKVFTVWAPTNEALNNSSESIPEDKEKLIQFLLNHISYERVNFDGINQVVRHKMANGKHLAINAVDGTIDGIALVEKDGKLDNVTTNGVLHVINEVLNVKENIWDYLNASENGRKQVNYILSQSKEVFNPDLATQIGVDPNSGAAIYDTLSGMEVVNAFLNEVADIQNEDEQFTFFILTDQVFDVETERFKKFYTKPTAEQTDSLTRWNIVKDVVVNGAYRYDDLDGVLVSVDNVTLPVEKGAVIDSYQASNGMVYVLNNLTVDFAERIKPILIEAEFPYPDTLSINQSIFKFVVNDIQPFTRCRPYASGGYDLSLTGHGLNPGYVDYVIDNVNTVAYQMYWVSVHEELDSEGLPEDTVGYTQSLRRLDFTLDEELNEVEITYDYDSGAILPGYIGNPVEKDLGVMTIDTLGMKMTVAIDQQGTKLLDNYIRLRVQGSGSNTPIYLDYIKMVPIIE